MIIGLVIILAIVACLAALVFGGVIMFPDFLTPFVDIPTLLGTQAPVVIENYLDYPICYVYINPSTGSTTFYRGDSKDKGVAIQEYVNVDVASYLTTD